VGQVDIRTGLVFPSVPALAQELVFSRTSPAQNDLLENHPILSMLKQMGVSLSQPSADGVFTATIQNNRSVPGLEVQGRAVNSPWEINSTDLALLLGLAQCPAKHYEAIKRQGAVVGVQEKDNQTRLLAFAYPQSEIAETGLPRPRTPITTSALINRGSQTYDELLELIRRHLEESQFHPFGLLFNIKKGQNFATV